MPIKADRWIRKMALEHGMIEPFVDGQVREGVISYGLTSTGTTCVLPMNLRVSSP